MSVLGPTEQRHYHDRVDPHVRGRWLSDLILGAQDGLAGAVVPVTPFAVLPLGPAVALSLALGGLGLFALGVFKGRVTVGRPVRSGLSLAVIGIVSALAGYLVGAALGVEG